MNYYGSTPLHADHSMNSISSATEHALITKQGV